MSHRQERQPTGFTLIEAIMVIVLIAILSVVAISRSNSVSDLTLQSQAEKMAADLRHAQALATSLGRNLSFSISPGSNGTYQVSCTQDGNYTYKLSDAPCDRDPIIDPATRQAFTVALEKGTVLSALQSTTLTFNTLGKPNASHSYALASSNWTIYVGVTAETGLAVVCTAAPCP